jgi:hypothetical protein
LYRTQPQHLKDIQRQRFEQHLFDVNGDGSIDIEEARMAQALEMATDGLEVDVDGDGVISQDERFIERQIKGREMVVKGLLEQVGGARNIGVFGHKYRGMTKDQFKDLVTFHPHHDLLISRFKTKERAHRLNGSDQVKGCWRHQEMPRRAVLPHQVHGQSWLSAPFGVDYPYGRPGPALPAEVRRPDINKVYPVQIRTWRQRGWD